MMLPFFTNITTILTHDDGCGVCVVCTFYTGYDIRLFQDVFNDCQCCSMLCHVIFENNMYSSKVITKRDKDKIEIKTK